MPRKSISSWKGSSVSAPVDIVRSLCAKYPDLPNKAIIEKAVSKGVARATAEVYVSREKAKTKKAE